MTAATTVAIPKAFIWRRIHSLMGLWLVLFLTEHLLTNSQAALWLGDNGEGFVNMVNTIHNLPYLEVIELTLLGVPILIHGIWGIKYLFTSKSNSRRTNGSSPSIPSPRNHAYTWQRITSWILLFGIIGHVSKFRFLDYPEKVHLACEDVYLIKIDMDNGLYTLADRLNFKLYDSALIESKESELNESQSEKDLIQEAHELRKEKIDRWTGPVDQDYNNKTAMILTRAQKDQSNATLVHALERQKLSSGEVVALTHEFGTASLLAVRNTFKNPIYIALYTIFVLAACFHASNGFWTFLLTWGWILKMTAQKAWASVSVVLMIILIFLGLAAIWGTYWINLRY